eukprot:g1362.t1
MMLIPAGSAVAFVASPLASGTISTRLASSGGGENSYGGESGYDHGGGGGSGRGRGGRSSGRRERSRGGGRGSGRGRSREDWQSSDGGRGTAGRRSGGGRAPSYFQRGGRTGEDRWGGGGGRFGRGRRGGRFGRGGNGRTGRDGGGGGGGWGRLDPETVEKGKILARRIKELGYARDFDGMLQALEEGPKNAIVCTMAISALGRAGKWKEAVQVLDGMGKGGDGGDRPDHFAYAAAINACGKAGRPVEAVALLAEMPTRRVKPDVVCFGAAIAALAEVAGTQNRSSWGRKSAPGQHDHGDGQGGEKPISAATPDAKPTRAHEKALALIEEMRREGPSPNQLCFASAITACARALDALSALQLLRIMREDGVPPNDIVLNAVVDACGKGGSPDEARLLLHGMEKAYGVRPDNVAYNSAISAFSRAGRAREARALLDEMTQRGLKPDKVSFAAAMQGFATAGDPRNAASLSDEMRNSGVEMDVVSYGTAVSACAKAGDVQGTLKLIKEMKEAGVEANTVVYNSALDACGRAGKPKVAAKLLRKMGEAGVVPNATSYTGAIAACSRVGDGDKALEWLQIMSDEGIAPEAICYNYAMAACGRSGNDGQAEWLLKEMRANGVTPNRISYSAAMFALAKAGRLQDVLGLLDEMHREGVQPDEVTYHIAIDAASISRDLEAAMGLFREMRASGLPVTKRRVEYIQEKISGGGDGGTGGGHKNDPSYAKKRARAKDGAPAAAPADGDTSSSARSVPAVKKVSRGAIHGGGRPAQHKAGAADPRAKGGGEEGEEEEAGADFLAELRERFAVDKEGLAGDADLDLLADDALFAAAPPISADSDLSGQNDEGRESGGAMTVAEGIEIEGSSTASGMEGGDGGVVEQVEERPDSGVRRLLEEIKTMKVPDLKVELKGRGLRVSGNKAELIARLEEAVEQPA